MEIVCKNCHRKSTPTLLQGWLGDYWACGNCGKSLDIENCDVCGNLISMKAFTCPQCGDPKNRR